MCTRRLPHKGCEKVIEICSRSCVTCIVGRLCTVARYELRTAHVVCGLALHNPCACWPACVFGSCGVLGRAVFQKPNTARHSCALHVEAPSWTDGPGVFTSEFGPSPFVHGVAPVTCPSVALCRGWRKSSSLQVDRQCVHQYSSRHHFQPVVALLAVHVACRRSWVKHIGDVSPLQNYHIEFSCQAFAWAHRARLVHR